MDELLDILDLLADAGLDGVFTWVFRVLGILAILAGIGVWLFTDLSLIAPAALVVAGLVFVAIPGVLWNSLNSPDNHNYTLAR